MGYWGFLNYIKTYNKFQINYFFIKNFKLKHFTMKIPYLQLILILSLSFLTLFTGCTEKKKGPKEKKI